MKRHANLAIFIPHEGCPHQCSFCDQRGITGQAKPPSGDEVKNIIESAEGSGFDPKNSEIAFFGGSFTAVNRDYMIELLQAAAPYTGVGGFNGIRISTRPDEIDGERLSLLKEYRVTAIELGAQSMDDEVLRLNNRGHTAADTKKAAELIREAGFSLGLQMMTGLYGDTNQKSKRTAESLAGLNPDTMRIYPTVVLKGTKLDSLMSQGKYAPHKLDEAVSLCAQLLEFFEENGINVIRAGLHYDKSLTDSIVAGPYHPAFRELCESEIMLKRVKAEIEKAGLNPGGKNSFKKLEITIRVHPSCVSKMIGQRRKNIGRLLEYGYSCRIVADKSVPVINVKIK